MCWALEGSLLVRTSSPQLPGNPPSLVERWPASHPEPWLPGAPKTTWIAWVTDLISGPITCVGPASCVLRHPADSSPSGHSLAGHCLLAEILFLWLPGMRSQHMHVTTVDTVTRTGQRLLPDQPPGCRVMGLSSATSSCNDDSVLCDRKRSRVALRKVAVWVTFSDALATPPSAVGLPHSHCLWVPLNLPGRTRPCTVPAWRGPGEAYQGLRVLGAAQGVRAGRLQLLVTVVTVLELWRVRPSEFTCPLFFLFFN